MPIIILISLFCFLFATEEQSIRRIEAHLTIKDPKGALIEVKKALAEHPNSALFQSYYIKSLAYLDRTGEAKEEYKKYRELFQDDYSLLEELCWSFLEEGKRASQYNIRLTAMLGAFATKGAKAVPYLLSLLQDSNAILRAIAIQLSCNYQDQQLKNRIKELFFEEKVWFVRLELLKAIGTMKIRELIQPLEELIGSDKITQEEKAFATQSLIQIYDTVDKRTLYKLATSKRGGLRYIAPFLILYFQKEEEMELLLTLLRDERYDVRTSAVNAFALLFLPKLTEEEVKEILYPLIYDTHPIVSITASWAAFLKNASFSEKKLRDWVSCDHRLYRRLAASAIARTGKKGADLACDLLESSSDLYVRANLAIGLIGQRREVSRSCDVLYQIVLQERNKWMWDNSYNPLFPVLSPSSLRYTDQIPNYPEAVDQMVRLEILSLLAVVEDPRAELATKKYLQTRHWGITGAAAALLVEEGSEESVQIVKRLLEDEDPSIQIQAALVLSIIQKDRSAVDILKKAYPSCPYEKKSYILEALGHIGSKEEIPFLLTALDEPFPILRTIAASSIIQCINQ